MTWRLGSFLFRGDTGSLVGNGQSVTLRPKAAQVLSVLIENRDQVTSLEQLLQTVWGGTRVEEDNVYQQIREIRRALGDSAIQTVRGRGFQLTLPATLETPDAASASSPGRGRWRVWVIAALVSITGGAGMHIVRNRKGTAALPATLFAAMNSPRLEATIPLPIQHPRVAVTASGGREIYVANDVDGQVVAVDTSSQRVGKVFRFEGRLSALESSPSGDTVWASFELGRVAEIKTPTKEARLLVRQAGAIADLSVSPDGRTLFAAEREHGVLKIDTMSGATGRFSNLGYAVSVAVEPGGKTLYVSYQGGGPGGKGTRDAIAWFDTESARLLGTIAGPPYVGNDLVISQDGKRLWSSAFDACSHPNYNHEGCPVVPGGLVHVIDLEHRAFFRSLPIYGALAESLSLLPDGSAAVIGQGANLPLLMVDGQSFRTMSEIPLGGGGPIAFSPDGSRAFIPLPLQNALAVLVLSAPVSVETVDASTYSANQAVRLSSPRQLLMLRNTSQLPASSIDPETLRLGAARVSRAADGKPAAWLENTRISGMHLLFQIDPRELALQPGAHEVEFLASTYGGVRVRCPVKIRLEP